MKQQLLSQFLLAAPSSGSGKTSIAMGLMRLFSDQGHAVQPYKCGPDYIDTKFHGWACRTPSVNLDTFMASYEHVQQIYARYACQADICIIEGMMGMYDGYDRWRGSSAEIAQLLKVPVILVVDAKSTAYSVAPLIHGFVSFNPEVQVAGVIFNRVGTSRHEKMLREACVAAGVDCLGCIPKNEGLSTESRYLGLDFNKFKGESYMEKWSKIVRKHVDIRWLLEKTAVEKPVPVRKKPEADQTFLHIAIASNKESFCFMYEETLNQLHSLGTVTFFDPETDAGLPASVDLLYLPGGYPEKNAGLLRNNTSMLACIREYVEKGGKTLAECGGMVYLSRGIMKDRKVKEMVGIFPFVITNENTHRRLALGYRTLSYKGLELRGHEFHYTRIYNEETPYPSAAQLYNARGEAVDTGFYTYKNVIASYAHLYLGEVDILKLWEE